jgi:hypothetical protein
LKDRKPKGCWDCGNINLAWKNLKGMDFYHLDTKKRLDHDYWVWLCMECYDYAVWSKEAAKFDALLGMSRSTMDRSEYPGYYYSKFNKGF